MHVYCSTIHNGQQMETTQMSTNRIVKENVVYIHNRIPSAIKGCSAILTMWMELEVIMLHETSQVQKDKYCMIPLL
jgi:hypothetical protein